MKNLNNKMMLERARAVMANSYSPYSKFKVGACLRTAEGQLFVGCNNENASYSLAQCAEASAIANMVLNVGAARIAEVVIIASSDEPCTPCGACRQRVREFADENTMFHMFSQDGSKVLSKSLGELLPFSFGPEFLGG